MTTPDVIVKRLDLKFLSAASLKELAALTEPRFVPCLHAQHPDGIIDTLAIAIGAFVADQPVGLILANYIPCLRIADMHSLSLLPAYSTEKTAKEMLKQLEKILINENCLVIRFVYPAENLVVKILEPHLKQIGWSNPKPFGIHCEFDANTFNPPWFKLQGTYPEGFSEFPWAELTESENKQLHYQLAQGVFPIEVSPFNIKTAPIDLASSLGLRYKDEVIGWMVNHRLSPDKLQYSALFIQRQFQQSGIAITMLAHSIDRQISAGIRWGVLDLNLKQIDRTWLNFVQRRLIPYASKVTSTNEIWRPLTKPLYI